MSAISSVSTFFMQPEYQGNNKGNVIIRNADKIL